MNKTIPIFFAIDDSYAPFLSVALSSAIQNASPIPFLPGCTHGRAVP